MEPRLRVVPPPPTSTRTSSTKITTVLTPPTEMAAPAPVAVPKIRVQVATSTPTPPKTSAMPLPGGNTVSTTIMPPLAAYRPPVTSAPLVVFDDDFAPLPPGHGSIPGDQVVVPATPGQPLAPATALPPKTGTYAILGRQVPKWMVWTGAGLGLWWLLSRR